MNPDKFVSLTSFLTERNIEVGKKLTLNDFGEVNLDAPEVNIGIVFLEYGEVIEIESVLYSLFQQRKTEFLVSEIINEGETDEAPAYVKLVEFSNPDPACFEVRIPMETFETIITKNCLTTISRDAVSQQHARDSIGQEQPA